MVQHPTSGRPGPQTDQLLALVAHELRRPLTALLGALATIHQRGRALSADQHQELLTVARRQGGQLQRLLDQLLVAAALDDPHAGAAARSLVDAAALATEAGVAAQLAHPRHPIIIEVAGPLLVQADSLAISRILGNLLDNAATYAPAGTPIRLTGGRDGAQAVVAVLDQGSGVRPEERERIFERYVRLDQRTGPGVGGLGVGLYIARRLARTNRGQLLATDPPGDRGARFELRLPLEPPSAPTGLSGSCGPWTASAW